MRSPARPRGRGRWRLAAAAAAAAGAWAPRGAGPPRAFAAAARGAAAAARWLRADLPRKLLELPPEYVGAGYDVALAVAPRAGREVPLNLMLDSGLTTSMLMPHAAAFLGLGGGESRKFMAADGGQRASSVRLEGLRLEATELRLGPLSPLVTSFPQHEIGSGLGCPIDGMLGMEFYDQFGVEVDGGRMRLYDPCREAIEALAGERGMTAVTATSLPAQLLGVGVATAGAPAGEQVRVLGIVDTGASFTVLNWAAASHLLGLQRHDPALAEAETVSGQDIRGAAMDMPVVRAELELRGAGREPRTGLVRFASVEVAVGDIALFGKILGGDLDSPAALVGQDIMTQRPTLIAARERLICFRT